MATRKPEEKNATLPFAALQLLAPPVRLVSAALWKVMKQRDVMQYGVVEEFVTAACETVPGLLTVRHQGKLALGLRGRLILELCCKQPDEQAIMSQLGRMRAPAALSSSSGYIVKRDAKILKTVESFHLLVHTLLKNPAEREQFFKEEFPVDYGPKFDQELEKLLWEFLIRLDQLLPVPNLAQTVSWLSDAPPVLEECARAATQPQLLKILLQHQTCLGHLEAAASLPPNMGDSILASLSLPPSGRVLSKKPTGVKTSATDRSDDTQTRDQTPFITPVIGIISNEDVPAMISSNKRTLGGDGVTAENLKFTAVKERQNCKDDGEKEGRKVVEERSCSKGSSGLKRKQPDKSESDEEVEVFSMIRSSGEISKGLRDAASRQSTNESKEDGAQMVRDECNQAVLATCMAQMGVKSLCLPEDPALCSIFVSCVCRQPRVVLDKLSEPSTASASGSGKGEKSSYKKLQDQRRKSPVKASAHKHKSKQHQKPDSDFPDLDNKE